MTDPDATPDATSRQRWTRRYGLLLAAIVAPTIWLGLSIDELGPGGPVAGGLVAGGRIAGVWELGVALLGAVGAGLVAAAIAPKLDARRRSFLLIVTLFVARPVWLVIGVLLTR